MTGGESAAGRIAISCGVYGFPVARATEIAVETAASFLDATDEIDSVLMVAFGDDTLSALKRALSEFPSNGARP